MAYGLKQVYKTNISENKFLLLDFDSIDTRMAVHRKSLADQVKVEIVNRLKHQSSKAQFRDALLLEAIKKLEEEKCLLKDVREAANLIAYSGG